MSFGQLKQIWNIMRMRGGPEELPFSYGMLGIFIAVHLLIDIVLAGQATIDGSNVISAIVNTLFTVGFVFVMLNMAKKQQRFVQTLLALLGAEILIGLLGAVLLLLYQVPALSALVGLLWLVLVAWNVLVAAHIFHHAMNTSMLWGMALAILYIFLAYNVVTGLSGMVEGS